MTAGVTRPRQAETGESTVTAQQSGRSARPLRLQIDRHAPHTGLVDGAWWPHSTNLTAELPDLLAALAVELGPVHRVLFHTHDWDTAPTGFTTGGTWVRLHGRRHEQPRYLDILSLTAGRIVLLVVPPHTATAAAHAAMTAAATRGNAIEDRHR